MAKNSMSNEKTYEMYETGEEIFCVIDTDNTSADQFKRKQSPKGKYRQSYRTAWESMRDFKGWLTSVPGNRSKAYCTLCQKELHCHRLSLLKHKVTFKHQKKEEECRLNEADRIYEQKAILIREAIINKNTSSNSSKSENEHNTSENPVVEQEDDHLSDVPEGEARNTEESTLSKPDDNSKVIQCAETFPLSTHVLDTARGLNAGALHVVLYKLMDGRWTLVNEGLTNSEGRYDQFFTDLSDFTAGRYKLHFDVDKYFSDQKQDTLFPFIEIVFDVKNPFETYHIPLLLSPYGFTSYKGS